MALKTLDFKEAEQALGVKLIENGKATQTLHEVVVAYQANRRAGTHCAKTRGMVNFSGKKPWRQKGTGMARSGSKGSPIWRGGGVVFGPLPRDYSKQTNKKVRSLALKKALSEAAKDNRIQSAASLEVASGKTKDLASWMKDGKLGKSLLIITDAIDRNLLQASRNIPKVEVTNANDVNAEQILRYKQIVVLEKATPILGKRLQ